MRITIHDYYMGRDVLYSKELTASIKANAEETVKSTNMLLGFMEEDGVDTSDAKVNSGWRPKTVNDKTPGADPNSPHVDATGIDLGDAKCKYKKWVSANPDKVIKAGFVATEEYKYTATWLHLQRRPPLSWQKGKVIWLAVENGWKNNFTKITKKSLL